MSNPDNEKGLKSIKNKFIAAVIVFFIPTFMNVTINLVSSSSSGSFDFVRCLKQASNIKVSGTSKYIDTSTGNSTGVITDPGGYEGSSGSSGGKIASKECTLGDSNVKLVPNDSHGTAKISRKANDLFSKYLAFGITFQMAFQAILNLMVVVGLIPVTGVTLPFLSYGGSSLLVSMSSMGIVLNIAKNNS